jgi:hypothetical protein
VALPLQAYIEVVEKLRAVRRAATPLPRAVRASVVRCGDFRAHDLHNVGPECVAAGQAAAFGAHALAVAGPLACLLIELELRGAPERGREAATLAAVWSLAECSTQAVLALMVVAHVAPEHTALRLVAAAEGALSAGVECAAAAVAERAGPGEQEPPGEEGRMDNTKASNACCRGTHACCRGTV